METRIDVRLNPDGDLADIVALERAVASIRIVLTKDEDRWSDDDRRAVAAIRRAVAGDWISYDRLELARDLLDRMCAECAAQGEREWWLAQDVNWSGPDGTPICDMLAEVRRRQHVEAHEALHVVLRLRAHARDRGAVTA